jgi:hypothetical protein
VLYTEHSAATGFDDANIVITPLAGGTATIVVRGGYFGRYVPACLGAEASADKSQVWAPTSIFGGAPTYSEIRFDLHPDGNRIAGVANPDVGNVVFVLNFFDYLRQIAPAKK